MGVDLQPRLRQRLIPARSKRVEQRIEPAPTIPSNLRFAPIRKLKANQIIGVAKQVGNAYPAREGH